ncbi:hypothetical protein [Streptomyces lavendofoliae]
MSGDRPGLVGPGDQVGFHAPVVVSGTAAVRGIGVIALRVVAV